MALTKLSDTMSLQMKMAGKEEQLTEKNSGFLQNIDMAEGVVQNLLREFTERDHVLNGPDEEDGIFSENPQSDFLHEVETTQWESGDHVLQVQPLEYPDGSTSERTRS